MTKKERLIIEIEKLNKKSIVLLKKYQGTDPLIIDIAECVIQIELFIQDIKLED